MLHRVSDWKYEVANGDTVLGYAEWVRHKEEAEGIAPAGTNQRCGCANDCALYKGHEGRHRNYEGTRCW